MKRFSQRQKACWFLGEDANGDVELVVVAGKGMVGMEPGANIQIAHPYQLMSLDMLSMVRVDCSELVRVVVRCELCFKILRKAPTSCSMCKTTFYCNAQHQKENSMDHRKTCGQFYSSSSSFLQRRWGLWLGVVFAFIVLLFFLLLR